MPPQTQQQSAVVSTYTLFLLRQHHSDALAVSPCRFTTTAINASPVDNQQMFTALFLSKSAQAFS
jgi:hypothetical protein